MFTNIIVFNYLYWYNNYSNKVTLQDSDERTTDEPVNKRIIIIGCISFEEVNTNLFYWSWTNKFSYI